MSPYRDELRTAQEAARLAGKIIRESYAALTSDDVSEKRAYDLVTTVDIASQESVVSLIRDRFPADYIVAEENTGSSINEGISDDSPRRWYVDPLDGTTNYIHAYPMFSASLALEVEGALKVGVTYDPIRDELFSAEQGQGSYLNDKRIQVSQILDKRRTLLATGFPFRARRYLDDYLKTFRFFFNNSRGVRRAGSAALDLAYVAAGRVDAYWEMTLSAWDLAAGILLVREAGGRVSDFYLGTTSLETGHIVASNGRFHEWMCRAIQEVFPEGSELTAD